MTWIILRGQKKPAAADASLIQALEKKGDPATNWQAAPGDWVSQTAAFLLGRLSEHDYLAAAAIPDKDTDRHCESWFYAGIRHLLAGDKPGAITRFKKCLATKRVDYVEYTLAQAQLQSLGATK
jgi:lipoprotein NlpI